MPLTDSAIRNAKPGEKSRKMTDEKGLYLLVTVKGGKWWRWDYRHGGKRKTLSMGIYPDVGLKEAREARNEARKLVAKGVDPSEQRKASKATEEGADSFEAITREWFQKFSPNWASGHSKKVISRFEKDLFPYLGKRPINEINAPELLSVLRRIEMRGAIETAHRAKQTTGQVFRYAVATGRAERDPTGDLKGAIPPAKKSRHAAITDPVKVGELLRAIDAYGGSPVVRAALQLSALLFVRPGELRQAEWKEIDLKAGQWVIPAEKMKMGLAHIVPLSLQVIDILKELHQLTGKGCYVFPGARSASRPLSDNGPRTALRAIGYSNSDMTPHGFRAMASTLLNEQGWRADVIERQLAHSEHNKVRAAYHRAEYLEERRQMMEFWSDYLEGLKAGADVVPIMRKKK